jgi:hypothetical protein
MPIRKMNFLIIKAIPGIADTTGIILKTWKEY